MMGDNPNSFDINDMVHEYGHFLQEEAIEREGCLYLVVHLVMLMLVLKGVW